MNSARKERKRARRREGEKQLMWNKGKEQKNKGKKRKYERKPGTKTSRKRRKVNRQQVDKKSKKAKEGFRWLFVLALPNNQPAMATTRCI